MKLAASSIKFRGPLHLMRAPPNKCLHADSGSYVALKLLGFAGSG